MDNQINIAQSGNISKEMKYVAEKERVSPEFIRKGVANGTIVILKSKRHNIHPLGVGAGLFKKVNSNIGTSKYVCNIEDSSIPLNIFFANLRLVNPGISE